MLKFKVGDQVKVSAGKDKGREGKIEKIASNGLVAFIPGVNVYKKHVKGTVAKDGKGGIYDIARPLSFAKISLLCPHCKKATRVGFRIEGGKKYRFCKKCDRIIENERK